MKRARSEVERVLLALASERGPDKTFCPSEAARRLSPDNWREQMPKVSAAAIRLVKEGKLRSTQQGEEVDPTIARAPLRFSLPRDC
jgi:hypothetical protein